MALLNETSHPAFGQGFSDAISRGVYRLVAKFSDWNDNRTTVNVLGRLSDRELDDIGLSRGDIPYIR